MKLTIARKQSTAESTPGRLLIDDKFECFTLEDVVREIPGVQVAAWKVASRTAIPVGTYEVTMDFCSRFGNLMPHILNVPGFDGIRIHSGNTSADTEGCILLGQGRNGSDEVINSRAAFNAFVLKLKKAIATEQRITIAIGAARSPVTTSIA